ncbi:MAG: EAL domain-containing protein [Tindallia sp. MSAO_Bac2]|nr:MAG: EAL domain-containing protein [Tindallia sp. MSAO_Bac2]
MDCKRCTVIPEKDIQASFAYLILPTHHHIEPLKEAVNRLGLTYSRKAEGYLIETSDFEELALTLCKDYFNSMEQQDIYMMPMKDQCLSFGSLNQFKPLKYWKDLYLGGELLHILSKKSIKTLFQPIMDVKKRKVYGYEALSRGIKKDGSIMAPFEMFQRARDMDLLFHLDRLCREKVIKNAALKGIKEKLFINFIPTAIYDPDKCLQTTDAAIRKYDLNSSQVVFEVVETERVDDYDHLNYILNYYKEKGYATALDDVGSGFASLGSLLQLKPEYMKIDMKIIRGIHENNDQQRVLKNYIEVARENSIAVLAEGVESEEEVLYLREAGVDLLQGYYFGKPADEPATNAEINCPML